MLSELDRLEAELEHGSGKLLKLRTERCSQPADLGSGVPQRDGTAP